MIQLLITDVMQAMAPILDNFQLQALEKTLETFLARFRIEEYASPFPIDSISDDTLLDAFIAAKRIEGCSEKTLIYYSCTIRKMLQ